jgi:2-oxoglutarate dehydrogenase complex dehydrogenase (E1) component-like enzyme
LKELPKWEWSICNGNGTSWPFEYFGKHIWKIYTRYFRRIEGKDYDKEYFDGDVKYSTADKTTRTGKKININLPNPSHLETVGAVIEGITRAKQDKYFPNDFFKKLPIAVHGDAVAGQGILYEIVQMAQLDGYNRWYNSY